jgi:nitrile hydratase accessory protein
VSDALVGDLAPPMANGEVVFDAPWQGRVFGMAHSLASAGVFEWNEFRDRLIVELARWDRDGVGPFEYYEHFQRALEGLLADRGLVPVAELETRIGHLAARPHGHDHGHHPQRDHHHD